MSTLLCLLFLLKASASVIQPRDNHQGNTQLEIFVSKETITFQHQDAFTPKDIFKVLQDQLHDGQCNESLVNIPGGSKAKFECNGDKDAIFQLAATLQGALGDFEKLFKTEAVQPCHPLEPLCRDCAEQCHDETRVTMPSSYTLRITEFSPTGNQVSSQAFLKASLDRVDGSDTLFCNALEQELASGYGSLFSPVAQFFSTSTDTLAITAACFRSGTVRKLG
ncbi:hypothetical protein V8F06_012695 [Rhypophila decipiens]